MAFYTKRRRPPTINIVSLIDVLCLLLIFFIVSTTFKKEDPAIKINLPESSSANKVTDSDAREPMVIHVTAEEKIFLDKEEVTMVEFPKLLRLMKENDPKLNLALRADKKAPFGLIIKVMDSVKVAGFEQLPAYTEEPQPEP